MCNSGWNRQGQNMLKGLNGADGLNGLSWMIGMVQIWMGLDELDELLVGQDGTENMVERGVIS